MPWLESAQETAQEEEKEEEKEEKEEEKEEEEKKEEEEEECETGGAQTTVVVRTGESVLMTSTLIWKIGWFWKIGGGREKIGWKLDWFHCHQQLLSRLISSAHLQTKRRRKSCSNNSGGSKKSISNNTGGSAHRDCACVGRCIPGGRIASVLFTLSATAPHVLPLCIAIVEVQDLGFRA